jgi:HEPN domain-containing protein
MKTPEHLQLVKDWLTFARENLLFAKSGIKEDFAPYHSICFMCQGCAEKYLKAFLIWQDWELKKTHDLSELVDICCQYDAAFEHLFPDAEVLNEYITAGRYPADLPFESIGKIEAVEAIEAAERIEALVTRKIDFRLENE